MKKVSIYVVFAVGLFIFLIGHLCVTMHWWGYGNILRIAGGIIALSAFIFANFKFGSPKKD